MELHSVMQDLKPVKLNGRLDFLNDMCTFLFPSQDVGGLGAARFLIST